MKKTTSSPKRKSSAKSSAPRRTTRAKKIVEAVEPSFVEYPINVEASVIEPVESTFVSEQVVDEQPTAPPETLVEPITEEPVARVVTMETTTSSMESLSKDTRRMMLWAGVSVTMFLVVLGWTISVVPSLNVPVNSSGAAINNLNDQFSKMYVDVNHRLDSLAPPAPPTSTSSSTTPTAPATTTTSTLTPDQINTLKSNVLGAETTQPTKP